MMLEIVDFVVCDRSVLFEFANKLNGPLMSVDS